MGSRGNLRVPLRCAAAAIDKDAAEPTKQSKRKLSTIIATSPPSLPSTIQERLLY